MKQRSWVGYLLGTIGVIVMLVEVALHIYGYFTGSPYLLDRWVLLVGAVIGFVGFYLVNSKEAQGAGGFLIDKAAIIITAIRTGKRAEDPVVLEAKPVDIPPKVTSSAAIKDILQNAAEEQKDGPGV